VIREEQRSFERGSGWLRGDGRKTEVFAWIFIVFFLLRFNGWISALGLILSVRWMVVPSVRVFCLLEVYCGHQMLILGWVRSRGPRYVRLSELGS
jgi:hypothetical protein